ncbi:MAG: translation elongation factor-like protein [Candidatus Nanoarchaeia archaeon]
MAIKKDKKIESSIGKEAKPAIPKKKLIGTVTHFFNKISVAVVELSDELKEGDKISIEGPQTNFEQIAQSMQIEHKQVKVAKKGQSIGLKVNQPVRPKDQVFKIE